METDLLPAQAAVDWAKSQFEILERRIEAWRDTGPYKVVPEFDPQRGKQALKIKVLKPLPPIVNAEVGAIINSLRTSLDLLTVALAQRNGHSAPMDVYFPISKCRVHFLNSGIKKIKRLSDTDKSAIEHLEPYKGGNDYLFALHQLDIMRKHRRLVAVYETLAGITLSGIGLNAEFPKPWVPLKHDAVLAWINPGVPNYQLNLTPEVALSEGSLIPLKPLSAALRDFAGTVNGIIRVFA